MADASMVDPNQMTPGLPTLDYNLESDKVLRRQKIAQMLLEQSQQNQAGHIFSNPMFTGYARSPTEGLGGAIAKIASGVLSGMSQGKADQAQKDLTTQADQRYSERNQQLADLASQVMGGGSPSASANGGSDALIPSPSDAQTMPLPPSDAQVSVPTPLPASPTTIASVLSQMPNQQTSGPPTPPAQTNIPTPAEIAEIAQTDPEGAANLEATLGSTPARSHHGATGSWDAPRSGPQISPQMAAQVLSSLAPPPNNIVPEQAPAPAPPSAPLPIPPELQGPGANPSVTAAVMGTPPPAAPQMNPAQYQLKQQAILGQMMHEGPAAASEAQAIQAQNFTHNDRYQIVADPINGGFVELDKITGRTAPAGMNGAQKVLETKDTPTGVMERTASGWRPSVDANGQPIMSTPSASANDATVRANKESTINTGKAVVSNQSALSSIDATLNRLNRVEQLYNTTATGPIAGHLPNFTSDRQELHSLLAQDIFAETRDAVAGAADAGGAPRMAQSEFKYMANNGGLSQNTTSQAATNLINQQRLRLNALKKSLTQYGSTLDTVAPAQQNTTTTPSRGQTVSAADYGFH